MLESDQTGQTTYRLATECAARGHAAWVLSTGSFSYEADDRIQAHARPIAGAGQASDHTSITLDELDLLMLRSNPSVQSPWAQQAGINFGRLAMRRGVVVLNDPNGLAKATTKLYLQTFPREVRPGTLITRDKRRIATFARRHGTIVLKPLLGSGGRNVFILRPTDGPNMEEMIRAVARDGYVIAQEYLPAAAEGDTRLFLMNGRPLQHDGRYAAFRRVRSGGDMRSNIHAGGKLRRAAVTETMLKLADLVRPRLVEDGMFLVGLDIVGDKLMEINVYSPGGLGSAQLLEKVDFATAVVDAMERKVELAARNDRARSNVELATL